MEPNVATLTNLANCREKEGRLASAWSAFLQVEAQTRTDPKQATLNAAARKHAQALEPRLSYLTISVADDSRIPDLVISRDSMIVDTVEWNSGIPIDSGEHVVSGKAPGHETWSTTLTIGVGERKSVNVPKFKILVDLAPKPGVTPPLAAAPPPIVDTPEATAFTTRRKIALGMAGTAVVVAGVSVAFGISAKGLRDDALARCPATSCGIDDAAAAQALNDHGRERALYANIGFGVAGAAAIGTVVLWFMGAPESPRRVAVTPVTGAINGFALGGTF